MSDNRNDRDDFWDLDKLLPPKRSTMSPFATQSPIKNVDIPSSPSVSREDGSLERRITDRQSAFVMSEGESYSPEHHDFIKRVTVRRRLDKYDFYESFRKAAIIYFDYYTKKCDFVKFYSYMPQYSQLNEGQKNYYFYWRYMLRRGVYLKSDYSYIYLFVYEILNLPDLIPPKEGIKLLCNLWREYRGELQRLDMYFSIWVQDYCLVHKLPCPKEELGEFIYSCVFLSRFKEFYLFDIADSGDGGVLAMLSCLSDYDWKRGRFSSPENDSSTFDRVIKSSEDYKRFMVESMRRVLCSLELSPRNSATAVVKRDAFPNCLCTLSVKCNLEIEYYPVSDAIELRSVVTSAVRYTENKLRALMGVKSRLSVKDIRSDIRGIIDKFFSVYNAEREALVLRASLPEYERMYDAPEGKMSIEDADIIERASWGVTARLTEGVDTEDEFDVTKLYEIANAHRPAETVTDAEKEEEDELPACDIDHSEECYGLSTEQIALVRSLLNGAISAGLNTENDISAINEAFADNFGDIIIETDGEEHRLIDDYREDVVSWLEKITK